MTLVGSIGERINIVSLTNGSKVARFNLITTNSESGRVKFKWYQLFCFGNLAQFVADYGEKGKKIAVMGKMVNRTYISKTGETKKVEEIEVRQIVGM